MCVPLLATTGYCRRLFPALTNNPRDVTNVEDDWLGGERPDEVFLGILTSAAMFCQLMSDGVAGDGRIDEGWGAGGGIKPSLSMCRVAHYLNTLMSCDFKL